MEFIEFLTELTTYRAVLRIMTPLLLAALGGAFTYHAGILNIALEGQMLFGAFAAVTASYYFGNAIAGVIGGILAGLLIGLIFGLFVVRFKTDEFIVGIAINILAVGATTFAMRALFGVKASFSDPGIKPLIKIPIPGIPSDSFLGILIGNHTLLTYISLLLVPLLFILFYYTRFGMHLRATGEHPEALETAGGNTSLIQWIASAINGVMCGLAGTYLALGYLSQFVKNMTAGRGFIALAALLFGAGNPFKIFIGTFVFGLADSLSIRFQSLGVPPYFALMVPYIVTIIALIFVSARQKKRYTM